MKPSRAALAALPLLAAAALTAPTLAQQAAPADIETRVREAFIVADVNRDGSVDIDEYVGYFVNAFAAADKNKDRFITPDEAPNATPAQFRAADRNGDGKLSLGEAVGAKVVEFFEIDTDRNGVITITEIVAYERAKPR